ncbi:hypothetical protein Q7P36_003933 [Cladosporium allicinum]
METSSQHEEHSGRAVIDCGPSVSNTNVSGAKHTCQSCGITASGSKPNPSSSADTASGPSPTSPSGPETANPSARGHEGAPRGANTANPPSGLHSNFPLHGGTDTARFTPSSSGPEYTRSRNPSFADPRGIGADAEEDEDVWLQRIDLRAVECCDEGIKLIAPPFPFYQRWDPQYRTKRKRSMARASDADYEQWTADGKPNCLTCGKRHPPPCSAPSRRKRRAEEPAEGSASRVSRRRRAVPRDYRASAQTAPATMALISEAPPLTAATLPPPAQGWSSEGWSTTEGWSTERWSTQGDWSTERWSTQGDWSTERWSPQGDWSAERWSTQGDWSAERWSTQGDWSTHSAQSTNSRPRGQAGRRRPRANRGTQNRRSTYGAYAPETPPESESRESLE